MPKIGPTHEFPLGAPINPSDRGKLAVAWRVNRNERFGSLGFGSLVNWVALSPASATAVLATVHQEITEAFGDLPFDASTLPIEIRVNVEKRVIEWVFPELTTMLVMNPEAWLALVQETRTALGRLGSGA